MTVHQFAITSHDFGVRLKNLRKLHGLSRKALAAKADASNVSIWNWETGEKYPQPQYLTRLAQVLGVSVQYLRCGYEDDCCPMCGVPSSDSLSQVIEDARRRIAERAGLDVSDVVVQLTGASLGKPLAA
jgi:DNA-binding XRE family transcriptional regulator